MSKLADLVSFASSPYVVKYYGSYFKNTDLWIVMEYCGAGSVSDIIRLRNKTVGPVLTSIKRILSVARRNTKCEILRYRETT